MGDVIFALARDLSKDSTGTRGAYVVTEATDFYKFTGNKRWVQFHPKKPVIRDKKEEYGRPGTLEGSEVLVMHHIMNLSSKYLAPNAS